MDGSFAYRNAEQEKREEQIRYIPCGECRLESEGWAAHVRYCILVETAQNRGDLYCEDYGARIELIPEQGPSELIELRSITPFSSMIETFIDRLRRHGVTPATARDVLEDYLLE